MISIESRQLKKTIPKDEGAASEWVLTLKSDEVTYKANVFKTEIHSFREVRHVTIVRRVYDVTSRKKLEIPAWDPTFWDTADVIVADSDFVGNLGAYGWRNGMLHITNVNKCDEVYTVFFEMSLAFCTSEHIVAILVLKDGSLALQEVQSVQSYFIRKIPGKRPDTDEYSRVIIRNITRFTPTIIELAEAKI